MQDNVQLIKVKLNPRTSKTRTVMTVPRNRLAVDVLIGQLLVATVVGQAHNMKTRRKTHRACAAVRAYKGGSCEVQERSVSTWGAHRLEERRRGRWTVTTRAAP